MECFNEVKRLLSQQVDEWGLAYTIWFYIGYTSAVALFTIVLISI